MTPDHINALFEAVGAWFAWRNAWQLYRDKTVRGAYAPTWFFFTAWGLWNLWYYPALGQWYSFAAGVALAAGNAAWCALAVRYRAA